MKLHDSKVLKIREKIKEISAKRKQRRHPVVPAPRYDEVFFRGMQEVFGNEEDDFSLQEPDE